MAGQGYSFQRQKASNDLCRLIADFMIGAEELRLQEECATLRTAAPC